MSKMGDMGDMSDRGDMGDLGGSGDKSDSGDKGGSGDKGDKGDKGKTSARREKTEMVPTVDDGSDRQEGEQLVGEVKVRYGKIATGAVAGCGCGTDEQQVAAAVGYSAADLAVLPAGANLGLGCGAPLVYLRPQPGETVLDLGAGAGIDAILAARMVGPSGRVIGVDMTPEMLEKARRNASASGFPAIDFREGRLEQLPVASASVDAVTSNCVINLVPDKAAVFREIARVLRPGGRLVISDIVLDGELPDVVAQDILAYVGCVAGALRREAYFGLLEAAGFSSVTIYRDVDYLLSGGYAPDPELHARMTAQGVTAAAREGVVRSVTYGAIR